MKTYDITIPITPQMPVWPGDPGVQIERVSKIEAGANANVSHLSFGAHTGTHVDAPYHFLAEGDTLEKIPLEIFIGRAYVVHLPATDLITSEVLETAGIPPRTSRVLFKTRNSDLWASGETEFQTDFVALSPDAAALLVRRGVKLVGVDYLSVA
ncbi:MAG: cyclase family protein, partial [Chloroflexi bacterium]|nr:cyclase family protein [Chloroflexota bacterium]